MYLWAKYGVQADFRFALVKRGVVDLAATADYTPATGDTKLSKDGGSYANSTNNIVAVGGTGSVGWRVTLTATELTCAELNLQNVDSATKAVEDQFLTVYTYGNASAKIQADLSDVVRLGLTSLPTTAQGSAGALLTSGTGVAQLNVTSGVADANAKQINGSATAAANLGNSASTIVPGTVTNAGFSPTNTEFECSNITTATANFWAGRRVIGLTGVNQFQAAQITAYVLSAGGRGHFTVTAMTGAFANGDTLIIV
jgi:hypothetical protein